ncbi:rho GTPase-activating protein 24-like isoform X2 [Gouania willdenowi]|uniref:rho GTPase-activating protein 24-like isoform X2 n=1 Tax=Gouania willdenowi TaxID=441366 RepID=UPI001055899D|nr:rho GTPase-activating protein 24-like isoform X2 [Gouania willdenowi]
MGLSCFKSWKHDRHKGNRDVLASPGSYLFLSNSAGQGDSWLQSLNKDLWIPFTGVFGQRLEETVLYEQRYGVRLIPVLVEQCVNFIRERGLQEVGLFHQPGCPSVVTELQEAFDSGERPSFNSSLDVHTVASLLMLYLSQLPEPLVPHTHFRDFLLCGDTLSRDRTRGLIRLRNLLHELPLVNFNLLSFICQFLSDVHRNHSNVDHLVSEFRPNVLRPHGIMGSPRPLQSFCPIRAKSDDLLHLLMEQLIIEHQQLFHTEPELRPLGQRGSSEEQSTPSQYDNLWEQEEEEKLYSWSSCEQLPLDDLRPPASPASGSAHSAPSSGSSDVFLPSSHTDDPGLTE